MERREKRLKDSVGLYNESCECESACTNGYKAYFGVQILLKILKDNFEKNKTAVFRKRISAKTAVFSAFKSVSRSKKSDDTKT